VSNRRPLNPRARKDDTYMKLTLPVKMCHSCSAVMLWRWKATLSSLQGSTL